MSANINRFATLALDSDEEEEQEWEASGQITVDKSAPAPAPVLKKKAPVGTNKNAVRQGKAKPTTRTPVAAPSTNNSKARDNRDHRHGSRGAGGSSGGGGGGGSGKRTFDRRSGTNRNARTKRQGQGSHNWGTADDEGLDLKAPVQENAENAETAEKAEKAEKKPREQPEEPEEPEVPKVSLDQYYEDVNAQQSGAGFESLTGPRKIKNVFKGSEEIVSCHDRSEVVDNIFAGAQTNKKIRQKNQRSANTNALDANLIGLRFGKDAAGGGRGRGRGGRGGRGRGYDREQPQQEQKPQQQKPASFNATEDDFPTL